MRLQLTDTEQNFLDKMIDTNIVHPGSAIYLDMVKKILTKLQAEYTQQTSLVSNRVNEIAESILYKIAAVEAEEFFEDLLSATPKRKFPSTKKLSLDQLLTDCAHNVDVTVLNAIKASPGSSRRMIANQTGIFLSTVCGSVNRLMKEEKVWVIGTMKDKDTNRSVETLGTAQSE